MNEKEQIKWRKILVEKQEGQTSEKMLKRWKLIGIDNETINDLMIDNKLMGMFFVINREDFDRVKQEIESN